MSTKTLRVTLADIVGVTGPAGAVTGEVWARYSSEVRLTDGTIVVLANRRKPLSSTGVVDFTVVPNDDASIGTDYLGFGIVVGWDLSYRAEHGQRVQLKESGRTITVTSADSAVVAFGLKAPAVPVIPATAYITQGGVDAWVASKVADPVSATATILGSTFVPQSAASVTQSVVQKLAHGQSVRIGVASDSTADAVNEWPYLLAQKLGVDYPTHTVKWWPAAAAGTGYDAATTIQTGTGGSPPLLEIFNRSVPGTNAYAWAGSNFTADFITPDLDLLLVATGHNEGTFTGDVATLGAPREQFTLRIQAFTEAVRARSSRTAIALIAQHEWQDAAGDMGLKRDELRTLAERRGYGFFDIYQAWADNSAHTGWFVDNIHLNLTGETFYADFVKAAFVRVPRLEPRPQPPSLALDTRPSLSDEMILPLTATVPIGWTAGNATVTRDTTNFESPRGYGVRIQRTAGGSTSRIFKQVISSTEIVTHQGKWVTVLVRMRRPTAGVGANGWVGQIAASDGVNNTKTLGDDFSAAGFMWRVLPHKVADTATGLTLSIYADGTVGGTQPNPDITVDRILVLSGLSFAGWPSPIGPRATRNAARFEGITVGDPTMATTPNLDLDAATGVARAFRVLTAGVVRWIVQVQNTESGTEAGSDLLFQARTDAGGSVGTAMTLTRKTMAVTFGAWIKAAVYTTAGRPNAATAGVGAQVFDSTLSKPIWSDGTVWRDAAGTAV